LPSGHPHHGSVSAAARGSAALARSSNGRCTITWLSRHLGHSSLTVTTDVYGHSERAERKREAALMEGVFGV
jgi:hypothetical protein